MPMAPVVPGLVVGSMPVGRRRNPRLQHGLGERWAQLRRAPRPVPTLLCAGLGLRGPSVDLLSRPPGWLGENPWGKGAGQRVSTGGGWRTPQGRGWVGGPQDQGCCWGSPGALGWDGLQQKLLQDRSCPLLQNWGAPVQGRREQRAGCPQPAGLGSCPGTQCWHQPPGWQRPAQRSNTPALSRGMGEASGTMGVTGTPYPCRITTGSAGGDTPCCPQLHQHPWSSSNAATAQSGPNLFPIQSQSSVARAASASLGARARLRGHGGRRPSFPSNVVFLPRLRLAPGSL